MSEDQLKAAVIELAELLGWRVFTIRNSKRAVVQSRTGKGWPDLALCRPPRLLLVELKSAQGRPTPEQHEWLCALSDCEGVETALWRPQQWTDATIEEALQ